MCLTKPGAVPYPNIASSFDGSRFVQIKMTATRELFLQDQGYPLTVLTSPVVNKLDLSKILTPLSHSAKRRAVSDIGLWWKRCVQSCACASLLSFNESYYLLDVIFDQ